MPKITSRGDTIEVPAKIRLVHAIVQLGIDIGHRCGGKARCTTCRVEFVSGEPERMTKAEYDKLEEKGLLGQVRLSCQILCDRDMEVEPKQTKQSKGWPDTGPQPAAEVEPEPQWHDASELASTPLAERL